MATPKIYVFCNQKGCDGRGDWHVGMAVAEDGTAIRSHVSSNHEFIKCDLGNNRLGYGGFNRDDEYNAKYPDGYEVVWVEGDDLTRIVATFPKQEPKPDDSQSGVATREGAGQ